MKFGDMVGDLNNNSVASFGLNLSLHQFKLLESMGIEELVIAFDRQYIQASERDREYMELVSKLERIHERFGQGDVTISFILDYDGLLKYKDSPVDRGIEVFQELYNNRFTLKREEDTA